MTDGSLVSVGSSLEYLWIVDLLFVLVLHRWIPNRPGWLYLLVDGRGLSSVLHFDFHGYRGNGTECGNRWPNVSVYL